MKGITRRQRECLDAIARLTVNDVAPTYSEIARAIGISPKSRAAICAMVDSLEARGYVERLSNKRRSVRIIKADGASHGARMPASYSNWSTTMLRAAYREIEAEMVRRAVT